MSFPVTTPCPCGPDEGRAVASPAAIACSAPIFRCNGNIETLSRCVKHAVRSAGVAALGPVLPPSLLTVAN